MPKINYFIFFIVCLSISAISHTQTWAPVGAQWHYTKYVPQQPGVSYAVVQCTKDTMIMGQNCKKIEGYTSPCTWQKMYTYKSNDSVYFYHPDLHEFCLLYDFGASTGDTWEIYNITGSTPDTIVIQVDSTDQIQVSGQNLKVLYTHMANYTVNSTSYFAGKIVENIGCNSFSPTYGFCSPPPGDLRCYEDTSIFYHTGPYNCKQVTVDLPENVEKTISVYPNPFSEYITIKSNQVASLTINIIDLQGKIIHQEVLFKRTKSKKINLHFLQSGFYILKISSKTIPNINYSSKIFKL